MSKLEFYHVVNLLLSLWQVIISFKYIEDYFSISFTPKIIPATFIHLSGLFGIQSALVYYMVKKFRIRNDGQFNLIAGYGYFLLYILETAYIAFGMNKEDKMIKILFFVHLFDVLRCLINKNIYMDVSNREDYFANIHTNEPPFNLEGNQEIPIGIMIIHTKLCENFKPKNEKGN